MDKEKLKNHALKNDVDEILNNIIDINKGVLGTREVINIDLIFDEVNEYNTYIYKNTSERDSDFEELEKNI